MQWVLREVLQGIKRPASEADNSLPPSADDKNMWSYTSPLYAFIIYTHTETTFNFRYITIRSYVTFLNLPIKYVTLHTRHGVQLFFVCLFVLSFHLSFFPPSYPSIYPASCHWFFLCFHINSFLPLLFLLLGVIY